MRRNCPKVFSRKLNTSHLTCKIMMRMVKITMVTMMMMTIIISIAIIMVSSLSAPWYVMYVHNPSNDRTYCNRPPGGNHIYLFLISIIIFIFFINIKIFTCVDTIIIIITKRSDFKGLAMQSVELGSNWADLRLNFGFPTYLVHSSSGWQNLSSSDVDTNIYIDTDTDTNIDKNYI